MGATTRTGLLTTPLRERFGVCHRLEHYPVRDLAQIVRRSARILGVEIEDAGRARDRRAGTRHAARGKPPAQAGARLRRGALGRGGDRRRGGHALELLEVDGAGLERLDREILRTIVEKFDGGPVGLSTLAVAIGEEQDTIEDVYEPYLVKCGLIKRTPRGRVATRAPTSTSGSSHRRQPATGLAFSKPFHAEPSEFRSPWRRGGRR